MPTLENNWYRRLIFFTVYLVQGMIAWLTLSYFPLLFDDVYLIDRGLYGIAGSLALLPMVFKVLIGPLSDKFPIRFLRGRNRAYIILGALLNVIFLPLLSLDPRSFFVLFFIVWFLQTLGIAIMDIMTDALAISAKPIQNIPGRTGASAWMFFGSFIGGGIIYIFVPLLDSNLLAGLFGIAIVSLTPLVFIFFLKERIQSPLPERRSLREIFRRNLNYSFVRWGLIYALLLNIDGGLLELTLEPYLAGFPGSPSRQDLIGQLVGITLLGVILGVVCALSIKRFVKLRTPLIDRIKKTRLLIIISLIYVIPSVIVGILIITNQITFQLMIIFFGVFAFFSALSNITYIALFLDLSEPKAAGTMIATYVSFFNLGTLVGIAVSGFIPMWFIFILIAVISVARIFPLHQIKLEEVEKTFYDKEQE